MTSDSSEEKYLTTIDEKVISESDGDIWDRSTDRFDGEAYWCSTLEEAKTEAVRRLGEIGPAKFIEIAGDPGCIVYHVATVWKPGEASEDDCCEPEMESVWSMNDLSEELRKRFLEACSFFENVWIDCESNSFRDK